MASKGVEKGQWDEGPVAGLMAYTQEHALGEPWRFEQVWASVTLQNYHTAILGTASTVLALSAIYEAGTIKHTL